MGGQHLIEHRAEPDQPSAGMPMRERETDRLVEIGDGDGGRGMRGHCGDIGKLREVSAPRYHVGTVGKLETPPRLAAAYVRFSHRLRIFSAGSVPADLEAGRLRGLHEAGTAAATFDSVALV